MLVPKIAEYLAISLAVNLYYDPSSVWENTLSALEKSSVVTSIGGNTGWLKLFQMGCERAT